MGWYNDEERNYGYTTIYENDLQSVMLEMIEVCGPDESFDIRELLFLSKNFGPNKFGKVKKMFNPTIRRMVKKVRTENPGQFPSESLDKFDRWFREGS